MGLLDFLFGKRGEEEGRMEQIPTMTPQQQQLLSQLLGGLGGAGGPMQLGIQNLAQLLSGAPEALEAYQRPELRRFEEETIPGIAERFAGGLGIPGAAGAMGSSAFGQALGGAGASLGERLAAQRAQLQQGAMGQLGGLLGAGLGARPFETMYREPQPGTPGFFGAMAPGIGAGIGGGLGRLLGGLFGGQQQQQQQRSPMSDVIGI